VLREHVRTISSSSLKKERCLAFSTSNDRPEGQCTHELRHSKLSLDQGCQWPSEMRPAGQQTKSDRTFGAPRWPSSCPNCSCKRTEYASAAAGSFGIHQYDDPQAGLQQGFYARCSVVWWASGRPQFWRSCSSRSYAAIGERTGPRFYFQFSGPGYVVFCCSSDRARENTTPLTETPLLQHQHLLQQFQQASEATEAAYATDTYAAAAAAAAAVFAGSTRTMHSSDRPIPCK